jgi:flagellar biosynthesis protein FlhB
MTYLEALKLIFSSLNKATLYRCFFAPFQVIWKELSTFFQDPEYSTKEIFGELGGLLFNIVFFLILLTCVLTAPLSAFLVRYSHNKIVKDKEKQSKEVRDRVFRH